MTRILAVERLGNTLGRVETTYGSPLTVSHQFSWHQAEVLQEAWQGIVLVDSDSPSV